MQLEKIKHKDGTTEIAWSVPNEGDRENVTLTSEDAPEPAFSAALKALTIDVLAIPEIDEDEPEEGEAPITDVTTVSISRDKNGARGFVFSVRRKVEAGTYSISTPRMRAFDDESEGTGVTMLDEEQMERVEELCVQATRYIQGHRIQGELALGEGGGEVAAAAEVESGGDPFATDDAEEPVLAGAH